MGRRTCRGAWVEVSTQGLGAGRTLDSPGGGTEATEGTWQQGEMYFGLGHEGWHREAAMSLLQGPPGTPSFISLIPTHPALCL